MVVSCAFLRNRATPATIIHVSLGFSMKSKPTAATGSYRPPENGWELAEVDNTSLAPLQTTEQSDPMMCFLLMILVERNHTISQLFLVKPIRVVFQALILAGKPWVLACSSTFVGDLILSTKKFLCVCV